MSTAHSDTSEFFRTCSIRDLHWFANKCAEYFISIGNSTVDASIITPNSFIINRDERTIPFPEAGAGSDLALDAFKALITCLLSSVSWDNNIQIAKQSRIRCRNTTLIALDQIYNKLAEDKSTAQWVPLAKEHQSAILSARTQKEADIISQGFSKLSTYLEVISAVHTRPPMVASSTIKSTQPVTLVIPSAGRSSRFPGHKPKWLLTQPNGHLMLVDAIGSLALENVTCLVVGVLQEHVNLHCGGEPEAILAAFADGPSHLQSIEIVLVVIEKETIDQVQTIERILEAASVTGPIFLKDCDNQFACPVEATNGVATLEITKDILSLSIPAGKSYVSHTPSGIITNIVEKVILGNTFCVGGYSFASAEAFKVYAHKCREYQHLTSSADTELAVSDIIWLQVLTTSKPFVSIPVSGYEDWGTLSAWLSYTRTFKTLFCDIDGTLIKNSGQYFMPRWGMQPALQGNVAQLKKLHERGRTQIILTTTRPESFRERTEKQLKEAEIPYDKLVLGLWHGQRVVINDYAKTNPFPSALAVNLKRNADDLSQHMDY
ncbi:hypothetical protein N431DRAFT_341346 [Stipitochalara longipes BDJ]|nr:hypothetical protein N431DRAFT_341346 [Stipitochalara longipes BDJ]